MKEREVEMEFMYRFRMINGHVHVRHFVGAEGFTRALAGTTVYREQEWLLFRAMQGGDVGDDVVHRTGARVVFVDDDKETDE
jgi:hypothetical protein